MEVLDFLAKKYPKLALQYNQPNSPEWPFIKSLLGMSLLFSHLFFFPPILFSDIFCSIFCSKDPNFAHIFPSSQTL